MSKRRSFQKLLQIKDRVSGFKKKKKPLNQVTTFPSFLESYSNNSFDVFVLTTLFEDNKGSNQDNNTNQGNS